jgi:hypothetical protein
MTRTRRLGRMALDPVRLQEDLARSDRFRFSDAYSEFTCGSWKGSCLCNGTGDIYDTWINDYAGPFKVTAHGEQMPYVMEVIESNFRTENLRFARLGRITPGSVMLPHRDFLELTDDRVRIHIPLRTDDSCFNAEEETIYHMSEGEVWYIDASKVHSAVSFSTDDRTHLVLDFNCETAEEALRFTPDPATEVDRFGGAVAVREPFTAEQRESVLALSAIVGPHNYRDVLAMLIKQYYVTDMPVADVYELAHRIAKASHKDDVVNRLEWLIKHVLVERQEWPEEN